MSRAASSRGAQRHPDDRGHAGPRPGRSGAGRVHAARGGALAALRAQKRLIAFAMHDVANPVYTTMVRSIQQVASEAGLRLSYCIRRRPMPRTSWRSCAISASASSMA